MLGILFALIPMLAWGSIGFISNKIGGTPNQQTFGLTIGAIAFSICVYIVVNPKLTALLWVVGILGGLLWSVGQNFQFRAMQYMGVSVANPISSGSQLILGSFIGVLIFKEWRLPLQYFFGFIALIFLVTGIFFAGRQEQKEVSKGQLSDYSKGLRAIVLSTFGYISYTVLFNNIFHFDSLAVILPMSIGMTLGALIFMRFQVSLDGIVLKNALVGLLWGLGNIFMLLAATQAGLAIAFSFSQLGVVISVLGGIFFLGEKKSRNELKWLGVGIICFMIGAIFLGVVKSL
ncbi:GRP family sugar transporter [Streptococcus dentiloxodontae]